MIGSGKRACFFGFEPSLLSSLKEALYFAGAEPSEVKEVSGFSKLFKTKPPDIIVMSIEALEMLDFQIMVGSDPQFDNVVIIVGVRNAYSPLLRAMLETCATDFFLTSQPYHLKRLAMAVMAQNPWTEVRGVSGNLILADENLERRIAIARSLRLAKFDVDFAGSSEELFEKLSAEHNYRMVISALNLGGEETVRVFRDVSENKEIKKVPWLLYKKGLLLANTGTNASGELVQVGSDFSPETLTFLIREILVPPMKEMRKSKRLPYFTPVKFAVEQIQEDIWGYSTDFSENGLYVRTLVPPPPNTKLTLSFSPPMAEGAVQLGARVAWRKEFGDQCLPSKHPGFGVEFERVSVPDRAAVAAGYKILFESCESKGYQS